MSPIIKMRAMWETPRPWRPTLSISVLLEHCLSSRAFGLARQADSPGRKRTFPPPPNVAAPVRQIAKVEATLYLVEQ